MNKLIILVFTQNFVFGQIQTPPKNGLALFNSMIRDLFNNCGMEFRTIGFWGDDPMFLHDGEADIVLLNKSEVLMVPSTRRIKFLVVILGKFNPDPEMYLYEVMPTLEIETMFVFDKNNSNEESMYSIFDWFQTRFENSKFYYCTETEGRLDIVTFNTFADVAPAFWAKIGVHYVDDDDSWSIFKAEYTANTKFKYGSELCKNIIFDRTKKLDGYKIKASAKLQNYSDAKLVVLNELITKDTDTLQVSSMLSPMQGLLSKFLTDYLDVSVNITYGLPLYRSVDTSVMIMDGTLDLGLTPTNWIADNGFFTFSTYFHLPYPSLFYYNIIVTHNRGLLSALEKMFAFYGWVTIVATLIIIIIAFIVVYFINSEYSSRLSFTVFECMRLLMGRSIYTRMDSDKTRIFFSVMFLYFLIMQATFSGHLAAFLTKPEYRKNVETLEDLKDPFYIVVYGHVGGQSYITDPVLLNKTKFGDLECSKYINSSYVACIDARSNLNHLIASYNLHTPRDFIKFGYASLTMRHNWALRYRVNNLVMRLAHSGITDFWEKKLEPSINQDFKRKYDIDENYYRPIRVADVMFAFILLTVGLFSAFLSFTVEYLMNFFTTNNMLQR